MASRGLLNGKSIIVTGAGGGIGEGIAKLAAAEGACVLVNDLGGTPNGEGADRRVAQRVVDEIVSAGGIAKSSCRSVASWDSAQAIVQEALDAFGRIDGVVNNAGVLRDVDFCDMNQTDWDLVRSVNLDGYFYVARAAAPILRERGRGAFVHMTSTGALIGNKRQANYMSSRLAVAGLSKSIALDMARFGVRSNCVAPFGFTRMVATLKPPADDIAAQRRLAFSKRISPLKVAPIVCALLSDEASDVTGQVFASRMNELMFFNQYRPVRSVQRADGWTTDTILTHGLPAFRSSCYGLDISSSIFGWDPF